VTVWEEEMRIVPLYCAGIGIEGYVYIRFKSPNFSLYPGSVLAFNWEVCGGGVSRLTWHGPLPLLDHGLDGLHDARVRISDFVGLWDIG